MVETVGDYTECKSLDSRDRFIAGGTVRLGAGKFDDFGDPAAGGTPTRLFLCHSEAVGNPLTRDMKYGFDIFEPRRR